MKNTKVTLVPLTEDDREQFILDNQWAFKYGAMMEFGERDDHIDDDGEIISRDTIERCIQEPYQLTEFSTREKLNDYLMQKYDVAFDQPTAAPFIMENDQLLDGYRTLKEE